MTLLILARIAVVVVTIRHCLTTAPKVARMRAVCRFGLVLSSMLLLACGPASSSFPEPGAWEALRGPGAPTAPFDTELLWNACSFLAGGVTDLDSHGSVTMYDGYLLMPWAPEEGGGGLSSFSLEDPCSPEKVGEASDPGIRETHGISLRRSNGQGLAAFAYHGGTAGDDVIGGAQIWDVTDLAEPRVLSQILLPGYDYPDSTSRVTIATAWLGDLLLVAGADNGLYVVDAADATEPTLLSQHQLASSLRLGRVHVLGSLGMLSSLEGARTLLVEFSEEGTPELLPAGELAVADLEGVERDYHFAEWVGDTALFARKESGGGFISYRFEPPAQLVRASEHYNSDGFGGHVRRQNGRVFVGDSNFAGVYDVSTGDLPSEEGRAYLQGDLDTATPIGNVMVLSVDKDATPGQASAVVPFATSADAEAPRVEFAWPADGAVLVPTSARIGVAFDEEVEFKSVFEGSFQVSSSSGAVIPGSFSQQGALVTFSPTEPLAEDTSYYVVIPQGGIIDLSGNATAEEYRYSFATGEELN